MDIQPIGLLIDAITMATKIDEKIDKKCFKTPIRRTTWDKTVSTKFTNLD